MQISCIPVAHTHESTEDMCKNGKFQSSITNSLKVIEEYIIFFPLTVQSRNSQRKRL